MSRLTPAPTSSLVSASVFKEADFLVKTIVIGDSGVGKSALLRRFTNDEFVASHITTIGVDFEIRTLDVEGKLVKLQIWDTAGQDRFRNIVSSYYRGAHAILVVFDVTDPVSFEHISFWLGEVKKYANEQAQILLVANKTDLVRQRVISGQKIQELASALGVSFIETSAKSSSNVGTCFLTIANQFITSRSLSVAHEDGRRVPTPTTKTVSLSSKVSSFSCCTIL